jgi:uncharacterized membrane protein (DUF4010 family)
MDVEDLFRRLSVSLAIGLLIGLERGWQARHEGEGKRTAGLRTFALAGLLGGVFAVLASLTGPVVLAAAFVVFAAVFATYSWMEAQAEDSFSVTGVVAGMLTFALGAYAALGELQVAIAAAVAAALLLAFKPTLHGWMRRLSPEEIQAAFILLAMTFLLLPVLPDRTIDPWAAINPAEIWRYAILIAALSFAGYVAVRAMGETAGILVAALAGGLASSTAATVTFARLAKLHRVEAGSAMPLAGGALLAGAVMFARIIVITAAINAPLAVHLAIPMGTAGAVFLAAGLGLVWRRRGESEGGGVGLTLKSPFELGTALKLAAFIGLISALSKIVGASAGAAGVLVLAAVSGLADVDALTLSMARLAPDGISLTAAAIAVAIAAAVNTAVKAVIAITAGTARMGLIVSAVSALGFAAAAASFVVTDWIGVR